MWKRTTVQLVLLSEKVQTEIEHAISRGFGSQMHHKIENRPIQNLLKKKKCY